MPDKINSLFCALGAVFVMMHCWRLHRDKQVRGVSITAAVFGICWAGWTVAYCAILAQWVSTITNACLLLADILWVGMMLYYRKQNVGRYSPKIAGFDPTPMCQALNDHLVLYQQILDAMYQTAKETTSDVTKET